jgi:CheY-like chemotaxis protein
MNKIPGSDSHPRKNTTTRLLLAEDDETILRLTSKSLVQAGYAVDGVTNGAEAWKAVQTSRYDLLITDHCMPVMTGLDLIRKLRETRMRIPVVMVTGTAPEPELLHFQDFNQVAVLLKPITVSDLITTLEEELSKHRRHYSRNVPNFHPTTMTITGMNLF